MNASQAKLFQILLFKLRMDARWDNLSLKNIPPPLPTNRPTPFLKMKIFWPTPKIENFQIPTPPLTLGRGEGGGVRTMD